VVATATKLIVPPLKLSIQFRQVN